MTATRSTVAAVAVAAAFLLLGFAVAAGATRGVDHQVASWMTAHRTPWLRTVLIGITRIGGSAILAPISIVAAAWLSRRLRSWRPAVVLAGAYLATVTSYSITKVAVGRLRPAWDATAAITLPPSAAFPSGHAAQSLVVAVLFVVLCRRLWPTTVYRGALTAAVLFSVAVGLSRIYLGVHWPTDVLGGWLLGGMWIAAFAPVAAPAHPTVDPPVERVGVVVARNPHAGSVRAGARAIKRLRRTDTVRVIDEIILDGPLRSGLRHAIGATPAGATLAVAGGDGTVGTAASLLVGRPVRLGVLPTGTGNDIARALGIPLAPEDAADVAVGGAQRWIDLGVSTRGCFLHALSVGVATGFAAQVRHIRGWQRPFRYPWAAVRAWRDRYPLDATVVVDGSQVALPPGTVQVAVVNAPRVGGRVGVNLPGAAIDDGRLYLLAISDRGLARWLVAAAVRTLVPQHHRHHPVPHDAVVVVSGRRFQITTATPTPLSLDGEPAGHTPVTIWVRRHSCLVAAADPDAARRHDTEAWRQVRRAPRP